MLGKLFKYEWKTTSKMGLLMLAALGVVTLLGVLGFVLPISYVTQYQENVYGDEESITILITTLVAMATVMVYVVTMMGVVYGMMIYLGVHFYKTMYSDEGYLTLTLPVSPRQLIISKVLNGAVWYSFICIGMVLSMMLLVAAMLFSLGNTVEVSAEMQREIGMVFAKLWSEMGVDMVHTIVSLVLMMIISPVSGIMIMFSAITIGQLASKYRALMGILAYFGISMIMSMISYVISSVMTFSNMAVASATNSMPSMAVSYDAAIIASVIMLAVSYAVSHHILSKKLNME